MISSFDEIKKILEKGTNDEKIKTLESLINTSDEKIINLIFSKLDDPEIQVRGEAFSTLVLNENKISKILISNLNSDSKNIKGFGCLVLANRHDANSIPNIIELTKDSSSLVRVCALGALGYLKAENASKTIHDCFKDSSVEVKKSALKAAMDIGDKVALEEIKEFAKEHDPELDRLVIQARKN